MNTRAATRPPPAGPWSLLAWLVVRQRGRVALGAVLGTAWTVCLVLPPYLISRAIDGLATGGRNGLAGWTVSLALTGAILAWLGIWRHRTMTKVRMDAAFRTVALVNDQAVRLGNTLAQRSRAGEVVAIGVGDVWTIGRSLTVTGPGVGAVLTYAVIAVLLFRVSVLLAIVVLAGVPLLALIMGPALGRLRNVGTLYRSQQSVLTGRIVDIIGGLSVLNGLGGKKVYADRFRGESQELQRQGYVVGRVTSLIQAVGLALPTLFSAVVVWLAARLAVEGTITVGQLVGIYGYAAVLVVPVSAFIEGAVDINRALVAGRRVTDFLAVRGEGEQRATAVPSDGDLVDEASGLRLTSGTFAVVATASQADATALVDRLGGYRPGASWNGLPISEIEPKALRRQVLVADNDAALFGGSLVDVVAGAHDADETRVLKALHVAAAGEMVRALPDGARSRIESGGRNLSGGQRQRVRLARATLGDPPVLLALDPTSAIDAATEALIVHRLARVRSGRTTLITSTSALMLARADQVHLIAGDRLVASGTHASLLRDEPAYAALVLRGETPDPPTGDDDDQSRP